MIAILVSGAVGLLVSLLGTPLLIRFLVARQYGQFIRQDGPTGHFTKRGTPAWVVSSSSWPPSWATRWPTS